MIEPNLIPVYQQLLRGLLMGASMDEKIDAFQSSFDVPSSEEHKTINCVNLKGFMSREDGSCGHVGTRSLASALREADMSDSVIGHIIMIDSGGGAANSVPDLADAITSLKKPCVAFVDGMMCSAAIYAGSYCDYIIANRDDDRIGCIGTMIQIVDIPKKGSLSSGEICVRVFADGAEEKNLEYEEALEGNIKPIKDNFLNPINQKFIEAMKKNRPASSDDQLKGRTFFAKDVVGSLIDEIGSFQKAVDKVIQLSAETTKVNNQNKSTMSKKFENINKIPSCEVLEEPVDSTMSLTLEQMSDIDAELGKVPAVISERDSLQQQLETANQKIETLNGSIAQKDARITELEKALEGVITPELDPKFKNGNHDSDPNEETDEADTMEFCQNYLKNHPK